MKLTLITPVYREAKSLVKFLEKLESQTNTNFEAIFVVDTNTEKVLNIIDEHRAKIKGEVKIIFNAKRSGRTDAITNAINNATGDYAMILSATNWFDAKMVETVFKKLDAKKHPDILEFNARFKDPIKFDGKVRKSFKANEDKEDVIAFTYPFDFNKVYVLPVLKEATKLPSLSKRQNSRYTVELVFKSILMAHTFASTSTKIVRSRKSVGSSFNPLKISREWEELISQETFSKYKSALDYNRYYATKIIYANLAATTKNKVLITKMNEIIKTNFEDASLTFFKDNKYILSVNKESEILRKHKNQSAEKAFKALND